MSLPKIFLLFLAVLLIAGIGFLQWNIFTDSRVAPEAEDTNVSELVEEVNPFEAPRKTQITDGEKHSVPLEDLIGGGPRKDGIPSIDDPKFVTVEEADEYLDDDKVGIAVSLNGVDRFYSTQILVWHEVVNDMIDDQPVLITYCPLCGTGIVYEPIVNGEITEFGTSGKLWNSNLVMYDRQTDSYWSQVLGEAIVGEMTGTKLTLLPYDNVEWGNWKEDYPAGEVLSKKTGYSREYNKTPYGNYATNEDIYFPVDNEDERYHPKEPTFTIEIEDQVKIYPMSELEKGEEEFGDTFADRTLQVIFNPANKTIRFMDVDTMDEVVPVYGFWFSTIAVHPQAEVYTSSN